VCMEEEAKKAEVEEETEEAVTEEGRRGWPRRSSYW